MSGTSREIRQKYWRANLRLMALLLSIWFTVSFGFGIILRPWLDQVSIGGAPLGFWFAQQGSIFVFVILIFYYAFAMNRMERAMGLEEEDESHDPQETGGAS
jgi:putative solute:sodium symporter small subunit